MLLLGGVHRIESHPNYGPRFVDSGRYGTIEPREISQINTIWPKVGMGQSGVVNPVARNLVRVVDGVCNRACSEVNLRAVFPHGSMGNTIED